MKASPFELFLIGALTDFEKHLKEIGLKDEPARFRLLGARQFADFLVGRKRGKHERTTLGAEEI